MQPKKLRTSQPSRTPAEQKKSLAQAARLFVDAARQMSDPQRGRRREPREPRSISLRIQPLNEDYKADGSQFWTVSRDISTRGLGFIMPEPIQHKYLKIGLGNDMPMVICEVRHCSSIGSEYPLYLVGVRFLDEYFE